MTAIVTANLSALVLLVRQAKIKRTTEVANPYVINFEDNNSYERKSKAFERSFSKSPNTKPWSKHCFRFP